jgi:hypothetical protein
MLGNSWGLSGSLAHKIIEDVLSGSQKAEDLDKFFYENLPELDFGSLGERYKEKYIYEICDFFRDFKGINDEVLALERHFTLDLGDYFLRGYTDLETKSANGKLKVIDWKTSGESGFKGSKLRLKKRQLYVYAEAMFQEYGEYPDEMYFFLIRYNKPIKEVFSKARLDETFEWIDKTVKEIESAEEYPKEPDYFFCENLCGFGGCPLNGRGNNG